ncbi:hypothetical protein B0H13DRAFT_1589238 [Mycena leptocephala]|nr:hypothetical protein B0H13DRAFT_1589238 [Mycena leptocephala]
MLCPDPPCPLHEKYVCIDLPDDVKQYITKNSTMRSPQVCFRMNSATLWKEILKSHPRPNFTQKSVYNLWFKQQQAHWRQHEDELESAKMLLNDLKKNPAFSAYELEPIELPKLDDGYTAIAFTLPTLIRKWGGTIREVALDSTFNTTKAGFECFALLGEVFGSGLPLAFLLIKSKNPEPGQKEKYIRSLVRHLLHEWDIQIIQSLSDKDIVEINALLEELPEDNKHQLCFWHGIKVVKGRLCVLGRHPAFYDVDQAFGEFDWIARDFVPVNQMDPKDRTPVSIVLPSFSSTQSLH